MGFFFQHSSYLRIPYRQIQYSRFSRQLLKTTILPTSACRRSCSWPSLFPPSCPWTPQPWRAMTCHGEGPVRPWGIASSCCRTSGLLSVKNMCENGQKSECHRYWVQFFQKIANTYSQGSAVLSKQGVLTPCRRDMKLNWYQFTRSELNKVFVRTSKQQQIEGKKLLLWPRAKRRKTCTTST